MTKLKKFKNRTVIGVICIIIAILILFIALPLYKDTFSQRTQVIRMRENVKHGSIITESMLETADVGRYGLPDEVLTDKSEIIGKYATADLFKNDYLTLNKLTDKLNTASSMLSALNGDKLAMSVSLSSFASGLSGKIESGDIVSVVAINNDEETKIPQTLKYVKVVSCTTSDGFDIDDKTKKEDDDNNAPVTATLLVSDVQAIELATLEKESAVHLALVCRADSELADEFLNAQKKALDTLVEVEKHE